MKKISLWARDHKQFARAGIVIIFILLTALGIVDGILLRALDIRFSPILLSAFAALFLTAAFLYPSKYRNGKRRSRRQFYSMQKTCDFVLAASTFLMIVFLGNRPDKFFFHSNLSYAASIRPTSIARDSTTSYKSISSFSASMKDETGKLLKWKERKKLLKEQLTKLKKSSELSPASKTLLVILSALVAAGLMYVVAGLSCTLSCDGAEGAALLVGIGGFVVIVLLLVITIRAIYRKRKTPKQNVNPGQNGG